MPRSKLVRSQGHVGSEGGQSLLKHAAGVLATRSAPFLSVSFLRPSLGDIVKKGLRMQYERILEMGGGRMEVGSHPHRSTRHRQGPVMRGSSHRRNPRPPSSGTGPTERMGAQAAPQPCSPRWELPSRAGFCCLRGQARRWHVTLRALTVLGCVTPAGGRGQTTRAPGRGQGCTWQGQRGPGQFSAGRESYRRVIRGSLCW